jgi:hypothetical protein
LKIVCSEAVNDAASFRMIGAGAVSSTTWWRKRRAWLGKVTRARFGEEDAARARAVDAFAMVPPAARTERRVRIVARDERSRQGRGGRRTVLAAS